MDNKKRTPRLDLNPSSAERWTTCTASPKFIMDNWDKIPAQDTFFSQQGTSAHEVAAALLQDREPDLTKCPVPVDADMRWHAWNYAEYVMGLLKPGGTLLVEQKLPLFYMQERNAIVDVAIRNPNEIHVVDFKYGEGVTVDPFENLQCIIYARSVIWSGEPPKSISTPIFIHIYQPRCRGAGDQPVKVWETTWGDIMEWGSTITQIARNITGLSNTPTNYDLYFLKFRPSEKACQWCPMRDGLCTARQKFLLGDIEALAVIDSTPKTFPLASTMSVEQLGAVLQHKEAIIKWLNGTENYALQFMNGGGKIPGYKRVMSRGGNRYWSNPKAAAKMMLEGTILKEDEVFTRTVIGPAAAEKLLGKQKFTAELTNLIARPPGVPTIAPVGDKRDEIGVDAATEFANLDEI